MFRLHKTKPAKSGERVDFKFSGFKALQVPRGWDKLFVSIVSVETGKTLAKSVKVVARNGNCQWNETLSESIWFSKDESSKELEDCPLKLVVAMGSTRSGILGEVILNMTSYMSSSTVLPVSFPLKKCNHGTVLQVKIQCLTPRIKVKDDESRETDSHKEDRNSESQDVEIKSEEIYSTSAKTIRLNSGRDLESTTPQEEYGRTEASFITSGSDHSYDSAENSIEKESFSPSDNFSSDGRNPISQDSNSFGNGASQGSYHGDNSSQSNPLLMNTQIIHSENNSQVDSLEFAAPSTLRVSGSSKSLLEAAENTIEDLCREAKMWERNARKLTLDLDILRTEYSEQSKKQAILDVELSAACAERNGLQKEVEQLKMSLEKSTVEPGGMENSTFQDEGTAYLMKEMENEIKFQKESNANLTLQLKRSQESNVELVAVLRELEEIVDKQKLEMENLSALQSKFSDMEDSIQENLQKNRNLELEIQQLQESEKSLQAKVQELEQTLEEKDQHIENESLNRQALSDVETEYKHKLSAKETEIITLKAKLSESLKERCSSAEKESIIGDNERLIKEIEELKCKLEELESDCQELTDENLELLLRLKEIKNFNSSMNGHDSELHLEENLKKTLLKEIQAEQSLSVQELESLQSELEVKVTGLNNEVSEKMAEIERLEAALMLKEEVIGNLQRSQRELEAKMSLLQKEKDQLEENMEIAVRESDIAAKCLNELQKDLRVLSSSINSHVSANKSLERKSSELERGKHELELHLSELKQENRELSHYLSSLEDKVKHLTDEKESAGVELENTKSRAAIFQAEIEILRYDMEAQKMDMEAQKMDTETKLQETMNQFSEAYVDHTHLELEKAKLEAAAKGLMEECSLLQKSNEELKGQNLELQEHCADLEEKLRELKGSVADSSEKIKILEENSSLLLEESAAKEKSLTSELDALLNENEKQNKKLSMLNQKYVEKMIEVENLQRDIKDLTKQLSETQDERERKASDAAQLREEIVKLELELNTMKSESEAKLQALTGDVVAFKQNDEILNADNKKMLKLLQNYKSCEEKLKTNLNDLELKLTVCEYERQQLMEESNNLKVQLLKIGPLQEQLLSLKNDLSATKSEKEKLETLLNEVSGECRALKVEKNTFVQKISKLQKAVSELEDCKHNKTVLEEKLLRMEGELMAKEAEEAGCKDELTRIKRSNKQLQWQIQQLEEEKNKGIARAQSLEEELILLKEEQQNQREYNSTNSFSKENNNGYDLRGKSHPDGVGVDSSSKIRSLEDELTKAKEANNLYKVQLKKLKSEGRRSHTGSPRRSTTEGEVVPKERFERTKSSLENELRELRERYLHMSLKYAEVEAQREELVMKLKAANNGKRWLK